MTRFRHELATNGTDGAGGSLTHRRWWAVAVAGLVLIGAACDSGAGSTSASPSGTNSSPNTSVDETERVQEVNGAFEGERYRTDGLTFVYPTDVYSSAAEQPPPGTRNAVAVDLATPSGSGDGTVVVTMVRSAGGGAPDVPSDDVRVVLARLEKLLAEGSTDSQGGVEGDLVPFVNGVGLSSVSATVYRYEGLTDDGRFLVTITGHGDDRAAMERIVSSLYVDGAAARFAGETCEEAVELVNENGLPEGETVGPGEEVTARWEVRNVGTCTWGSAHAWVFTGGEPVAIVAAAVSPTEVAPNGSALMTVTFRVPDMPGRYAAQWQLQPPRSPTVVGPAAFALFEVEPI